MSARHFLSLRDLSPEELGNIIQRAIELKALQKSGALHEPLRNKMLALVFDKSSTRTRVSFETGMTQLGGNSMFLSPRDTQLGRGEPIKDTARVLGRMVQGTVFRTFAQSDVEEFARYAQIPTINALTDHEHPCQILADIFTFQEKRGPIRGKVVTFIGDGVGNVATSLAFASGKAGFELRLAAPKAFQPSADLLKRAGGKIVLTEDVQAAATGADLLYTDVWVSMGREADSDRRNQQMSGYQINAAVVRLANPGALVMHCLPAYRGKEIDEETFEANAQTIFDQSENRLHVQKAILAWLVR